MNDKKFYLNSVFDTKSLNKKTKSIKIAGYANTTAKDRAGDIITADAWAKGVDNFRRNPVLLYQHKHDNPIGKVNKIQVDKKGIFVEASVSEAAEKNHGVQTLIKDGALKSFSVGFKVKDGKYNREDDTMMITDVELLEISVVSVPCNQDSLFSISKNFDSDAERKTFLEQFEDKEQTKAHIKAGITDMADGHYHTLEVDENGDGITTYASHMQNHSHKVLSHVIQEAEGHKHNISVSAIAVHDTEVDTAEEDSSERPLSPSEEMVSQATSAEIPESKNEEVISQEKTEDMVTEKEELDDDEEELEVRDPNAPIEFINLLEQEPDMVKNGATVELNGKTYKVTKVATDQSPTFKFLEVDAEGNSCDNTLDVDVNNIKNSKGEENKSETSELHENSHKEEIKMANQEIDTPIDLTTASQGAAKEINKAETTKAEEQRVAVAEVSEPEVAKLVEKTGEAIMKEADAQDRRETDYTPKESADVAELKAQISTFKDQIKSLSESKMTYQENSRSQTQFSEKEMANAYLLSKCMNKRDVFDTKYGSRMKAVTAVDQFLSNFSSNIYTEMEQQLIIAPMFERIAVDAKNFRVPVADEDTDGDVAQFKSGTFATGIADGTNVPATNQNTISAVTFTPHKFMATTHLAKDEEEDTVLPLLDFLRAAATRRLARAIDKSILRGTGALSGFTASPTNAITAGTGFASVIEGLTNLASDASLTVATGGANDKVDPTDIAGARSSMGKYGLQLGDQLVYLTTIEGYNNLVQTSDFRTVDKFGPNATYLTGSVGAVYGIPIQITEFLDVVGGSGRHIGMLVYKPGFLIAERRGMEIESEYEPRQQVTAMYMSTRFDFRPLTTNSSNALDATKYSYAVMNVSG
jgi:HK97 family phage prohead protease/HK97 family phage major capsid protein